MAQRRQSGVALLAAVLVVALATVLIAAMLDHGEAGRDRTRNTLRSEQTWQLALGAEYWVQTLLQRDHQEQPNLDGPGDAWSRPIPPLPVPGGQLLGRLRDSSGCFNLNALARVEDGDAVLVRLRRLLRALKLDEGLAEAIKDWVDIDSDPTGSSGAEDGVYLGRRPSYRTANRPMAHISELRRVRGIDTDTYQALRPHVCALPDPQAKLNLNFASPAVWMSLDERISEQIARQMWRDGQARFGSPDEAEAALLPLGVSDLDLDLIAVTYSSYFTLEAEVQVDDLPFQFGSLLFRDEQGRVHTLARVRGRW